MYLLGDEIRCRATTGGIYRYVDEFYRDNGYTPLLAQVGKTVRMSSRSAVQRRIWQLAEDERLINAGGKYLSAGAQALSDVRMVPVLGTIAAGVPIEAIEDLDVYVADLPILSSSFIPQFCNTLPVNTASKVAVSQPQDRATQKCDLSGG
ncbi:hypothetical protein Ethha_0642 [Ethanoligenens harbinense YUAN-3]|uniref:Uncharacterized protein n=1 Tax=Ethanoligenens harbinense (strain DSM 18485 / JCM 12961 / CGMCC 1.5033 / YUAN-3) TaxID=663278 RepID=E6U9U7_ETHHY|nr:hypothetical protein Ethha_0642 [Ethanoligenens harbinense YUAN-3]